VNALSQPVHIYLFIYYLFIYLLSVPFFGLIMCSSDDKKFPKTRLMFLACTVHIGGALVLPLTSLHLRIFLYLTDEEGKIYDI
jgi:hypothetical protein